MLNVDAVEVDGGGKQQIVREKRSWTREERGRRSWSVVDMEYIIIGCMWCA